jgi:hypothetical protein
MPAIHFSPLTAQAVGPAGPPSLLTVGPHAGPSTAVVIKSGGVVKETDLQWIQLGLTVPGGIKVKSVVVCYQVVGRGSTYISQTRLTQMTTPDVALVVHDDPTNLTSTLPVCYKSKASGFTVSATITLELKIVIGRKSDKILVGGIALLS